MFLEQDQGCVLVVSHLTCYVCGKLTMQPLLVQLARQDGHSQNIQMDILGGLLGGVNDLFSWRSPLSVATDMGRRLHLECKGSIKTLHTHIHTLSYSRD